ncbi:olfactory receptor class A-like protein 1 [Protopterus annectens]|uniref:olfactory receptor class A-like protein 1 n=1 Tax=Protopterus annectens TaxID=7888 RepID=UPI001CFB78B2|nr:olfactory receptor class A-like protein 1 [Protopterus annectens]
MLTFLLSFCQTVSISPASSKLSIVKPKISQYLSYAIILLYVSCYISNGEVLYFAAAEMNNTITRYGFNLQYCFVNFSDFFSYALTGVLQTIKDILFIVGMTATSCHSVVLLLSHNKKVKKIRSTERSAGDSAEIKAAKSVVTLVTLYVIFYGVDTAIWVYSFTVPKVPTLHSNIRLFFSTMYTTVCSVVVLITNPKIRKIIQCKTFI